MAMNDNGQMNDPDQQAESDSPELEKSAAETRNAEGTSDRNSRMNAAKAFYRAMYAGEDVEPEQFGMGTKTERSGERGGPCPHCQHMTHELKEAQQKASEAENLYKRMAADFENYRRRIDREREEFQALGIQRAAESILPALDDLDRAQTSLANVTDTKSITESLKLVYSRFNHCLEQIGVKPLDVVGKPFDPRFHEPVQEIPTDEFEEGSVVHELRRGYTFGEKVLRPSLVNVASAPTPEMSPTANGTPAGSDKPTAGADPEDEIQQPEPEDNRPKAAPTKKLTGELTPGSARSHLIRKKEREHRKDHSSHHRDEKRNQKHDPGDSTNDE